MRISILTPIWNTASKKARINNTLQTTVLLVFLLVAVPAYRSNSIRKTAAIPTCASQPDWPVCTLKELIPLDKCSEFLDMVEKKYGVAFLQSGNDSLDGLPAMQLDVIENSAVAEEFQDMYEWLKPYLTKLTAVMTQNFGTHDPYWVYLKRYSADSENHGRTRLRIHADASAATAIVAFTRPGIDFEGGKYQIFHRNISDDIDALNATVDQVLYPEIAVGGAILHDGALRHRVEEVTQGWRYSLIVFFPCPEIEATFRNTNSLLVLLYWVSDSGEEVFQSEIAPGETAVTDTHAGHTFVAKAALSDVSQEVVARWTVYWFPETQEFHTSESVTQDTYVDAIKKRHADETSTIEAKKLDDVEFDFVVPEGQSDTVVLLKEEL